MLIEIPVLIGFDCRDRYALERSHNLRRMFTMRYDTDPDRNAPVEFCNEWPPKHDSSWWPDKSDVLVGLLTANADKEIAKRAAADPESYAALYPQERADG